jgi:molybdate transport system ATP-binding protein
MSPVRGLRADLVARIGSLPIQAELDTGEGTLVLVGPNGAGKTSLLALLLGALPLERGQIVVDEHVLVDTRTGVHTPLEQRRLGYVPQDYALFPHLSVRQNLAFAVASVQPRAPRSEQGERVQQTIRELGLEALAERRAHLLSGGEKQRVALARALAASPRALLLDEPLAALDVHARGEVRDFLIDCLARIALPTVLVTHDAEDARLLGRHIAVLEAGRITQLGTWQELVEQPSTPFVRRFASGQ